MRDHEQRRGRLYVALAALAWSTAGILQRELSVDTATQLAGRAGFAALGVGAYVAIAERGHVLHAFRAIGGAFRSLGTITNPLARRGFARFWFALCGRLLGDVGAFGGRFFVVVVGV